MPLARPIFRAGVPGRLAIVLCAFVLVAGALLAFGLRRSPEPGRAGPAIPLRRAAAAAGALIERADRFLRRWPTAALVLMTLVTLLFATMLSGQAPHR